MATIGDLAGRVVGFGAKDSPQATLIPREHLLLAGLGQNELGYLIPESDFLLVGPEELLFGGGPGSVSEHPNYYADEFSLGPRAGDHYLVRSGLAEGELVVTRGAFKIDSALQIRAEPSMMSADPGHDHD